MTTLCRGWESTSTSASQVRLGVETAAELESLDSKQSVWKKIRKQIVSFETLLDDWDGQGADAIPLEVVSGALILAQTLEEQKQPLPRSVTPTPVGTIVFTWGQESDLYDLEIVSAERAEYMIMESGKPPQHGQLALRRPPQTVAWH